MIDIHLYSHHLPAWYCIDIVKGEILSWSLVGVKGLKKGLQLLI